MNSYDLSIENGRTSGDVRHRFTMIGTITSPWWGLVFNPFIIANTGPPFNITTGQDLNLDRAFNERPTFAQLNAFCTTRQYDVVARALISQTQATHLFRATTDRVPAQLRLI